MNDNFKKELEILINRYSLENASNTPDFLLAEYLYNCLNAFNLTTQQRTSWFKGAQARGELSQRLSKTVSQTEGSQNAPTEELRS